MKDYGYDRFREIGKLSSMLPSYVRHCCRAMHDGTDIEVLEAYRTVAYKVLLDYEPDHTFVKNHMELFRLFPPEKIQKIISQNRGATVREGMMCLATSTAQGLPKRACLHCHKVSGWIHIMKDLGTMGEDGIRKDI